MSSDSSPLPETSRELTDRPRHADAPGEPDGPPHDRLRILDLLIWTACIAACLGWYRFALEFRGIDWSTTGTRAVEWGLRAVVVGTAIAAIFLVGPKVLRRRTRHAPLAPGESLWMILGVEAGMSILLVAAEMLGERVITGGSIIYDNHTTRSLLMAGYGVAAAVLSAALAVAAYMILKSVHLARWQAIFGCLALVFLLESLGYGRYALGVAGIVHVANGTLKVFPAPLILIALVLDWRSRDAFPWKHWMGSVVFLGSLVMTASFLLGWP